MPRVEFEHMMSCLLLAKANLYWQIPWLMPTDNNNPSLFIYNLTLIGILSSYLGFSRFVYAITLLSKQLPQHKAETLIIF